MIRIRTGQFYKIEIIWIPECMDETVKINKSVEHSELESDDLLRFKHIKSTFDERISVFILGWIAF